MTDAELNILETAAKFAAPGPWREEELYPDRSVGPMQVFASNDRVVADCGYSTDSFYIAAANPTTIQELIADVRQARAERNMLASYLAVESKEHRSSQVWLNVAKEAVGQK